MDLPAEKQNIEATVEVAERQRRWLRRGCWIRCSLTLLAVVVVMSFPLYARWQLRRHGWELGTSTFEKLPSWAPNWEWAELWFGRLEHAHLRRTSLQLSDLDLLRHLPEVEWILLESTDLSDSALEKIAQFPYVSMVTLISVKMESTGLRHLSNSTKLEAIVFFDMTLAARDLEHLASCRHLTETRIEELTDENGAYLSRLPRLKRLELSNCRLTNDGVKQLADGCLELEVLFLSGGKLSDAAVAEFARLPKLDHLDLGDMAITDEGLLNLKACAALKSVRIWKTKVTDAGVAELRKSHPSLSVSIQ
jgi:hypothetical protein